MLTEETIKLAEMTVDFKGKSIVINPVIDTLFRKDSVIEKEEVSAMTSFYGAIYADQVRLLSRKELEKKQLESRYREDIINEIHDSGRKETIAAVEAGFIDRITEYPTLLHEIIDIQYNITVLEKTLYALKSKSEHVKELLKPEKLNG